MVILAGHSQGWRGEGLLRTRPGESMTPLAGPSLKCPPTTSLPLPLQLGQGAVLLISSNSSALPQPLPPCRMAGM